MTLAPDGRIIVAVPNYNNLSLAKQGGDSAAAPARLAVLDPMAGTIENWFDFKPADLSPVTHQIAPMGVAFGPDGNLYFVDRQSPYGKGALSRVMRVVVANGIPMRAETVIEGGIGTNDLIWHNKRLYVTDAGMTAGPKTENLVSGVYVFTFDEFNRGPVKIAPYEPHGVPDSHLIATFLSNHKVGAGADGITFDDANNLYIGVNEEGTVWKAPIGIDGRLAAPFSLFARDFNMLSTDGMIFDRLRRRIYVADFLGNAVHAIDLQGRVITLQKNGDADSSTGQLDQPCALLLLGNRILISNMDYFAAAPGSAVNITLNDEHAITSLDLGEATQTN
jgi:DNA-binding beta-propeller fold protein YncE